MTAQREPVGRAIDVLGWMADHPKAPWSIRQVARDLETSPTTIHRIFGVFEAQGLLQKDANGGYSASLELHRLCRLIIVGQDLPVTIARPHLEILRDKWGETVMLGVYDPKQQQMMYLDVLQSHHPVQHIVVPNMWRSIHAGAAGMAILAFLPEAERRRLYEGGLEAFTDRTLVEVEKLEERLGEIRRDGYACTRGLRRVGAVGMAAPVFDSVGNVFGDVVMTVPEQRFDPSAREERGRSVAAAAAEISEKLRAAGYRRAYRLTGASSPT